VRKIGKSQKSKKHLYGGRDEKQTRRREKAQIMKRRKDATQGNRSRIRKKAEKGQRQAVCGGGQTMQ